MQFINIMAECILHKIIRLCIGCQYASFVEIIYHVHVIAMRKGKRCPRLSISPLFWSIVLVCTSFTGEIRTQWNLGCPPNLLCVTDSQRNNGSNRVSMPDRVWKYIFVSALRHICTPMWRYFLESTATVYIHDLPWEISLSQFSFDNSHFVILDAYALYLF